MNGKNNAPDLTPGDALVMSLTQAERAEIYRNFIETYNNDEIAEKAMNERDDVLKQLYYVARLLDERRRSAIQAGSTTSEKKARQARENGKRGGRPRSENPSPAAIKRRRSRELVQLGLTPPNFLGLH